MQIIHSAQAWLLAVQADPTSSGVMLLCTASAGLGIVLGFVLAIPVLGTLAWGLRR